MKKYIIDNVNKTVVFEFPHDKDIIKAIKSCGYKSRWNSELRRWIVSIDDYTKPRVIDIINRYKFTAASEEEEKVIDFDYNLTISQMSKLGQICDSKQFTYTPRKYQLEALGYAIKRGNIINGDDVGIGKTFEAIMYAEATNSFPCLVIVPASVKDQWQEKWDEITDGKRTVATIESKETKKNKNNWDADVVVINYDITAKKQGKGATVKFKELVDKDWKMIIFDEAHFLKEKKSQRAMAAKKIVKGDAIIQMLSGTITMSRPKEIWNLLVLAKVDHLIAKDWHQFITRYCDGYRDKFGWNDTGATKTIELNRKMREAFYIRREKRDVLTELPDVEKQILRTPITNAREIKLATTNFIEYLYNTKGEEAAERAMEAEHLVALGALRKLAIEGKLKAIEQYLKDWKQGGEKLVVFGLHREQLDYLSEKFKCPLIAGGLAGKKKRQTVKDWLTSDDVFLFANMQSAGTGVDDLQTVCSNMLITELPWRPSDLEQAIGRLDRSGQETATNVTFMLADNTIDDEMWEMLEEKETVTEAVNKGIDIIAEESGMRMVMRKILEKQNK